MRILIAEDDPVSRRVLEAMLVKWGYGVLACSDGAEAWQALQCPDASKLAILDWMMPIMDGVQVCQKVRAEPATESMYIILLTAKTEKDAIVAGLEAGADDYVTKPFNRSELRARLQVGVRVVGLQQTLAERAAENARLNMMAQTGRALAHHIRNALTPLLGLAEMLEPEDISRVLQLRETVVRNGQRIAATIDALIQMAETGYFPTIPYGMLKEKEMLDMDNLIERYLKERLGSYEK
jgi:DNA-binding response OmpR family regulator